MRKTAIYSLKVSGFRSCKCTCLEKTKNRQVFNPFSIQIYLPAPARLKGPPFVQDAERRPKRPEALGSPVDARARARARALSKIETAKLECRRLDLAATAAISLLLEHNTTKLPSLSISKRIFARASRHTEICTPQVDTFADLAKITPISKKRYGSKKIFIFVPHMTSANNTPPILGGEVHTRKCRLCGGLGGYIKCYMRHPSNSGRAHSPGTEY